MKRSLTPFQHHIGSLIREARRKAGMKIVDLHEATGIAQSTLSRIEIGQNDIKLRNLYAITSVIGIEVTDLLPKNECFYDKEILSKEISFKKSEYSFNSSRKDFYTIEEQAFIKKILSLKGRRR